MNKAFSLIIWATVAMTVVTSSSRVPRQVSSNTGGDEFQTEPRRAVVRPGESVTLLGNAGTPLAKCHFYMPDGKFLDFSQGPDSRSTNQYEYFGRGLDNGECGLRIKMADSDDDGIVECKVKPESSGQWERCVTTLRVTTVSVSEMPVFEIAPRSATLARGDDVTITCNADRAINMCQFYLPGPRHLNLDRGAASASTAAYRYHGTGLRDGQCGVTLTGVDTRLTGYVVCKLGVGQQAEGAWETDALKITTTNEVSGQYSTRSTTRRPSQSNGNRPIHSTEDSSSHQSQSNGNRPTSSNGNNSGQQSRPSQSNGNRPTTSIDNNSDHQARPLNGNGPTSSNEDTFTNTQSRPSQSNVNKPTHSNDGSDDAVECGRVKLMPAALVTNGQGTEQGQWPWHVAMYQNKGKDLTYICGGSLISRNAVVTAAHCVTRRPSESLVNTESLVLYFGKYRRLIWSEGGVQNKQIEKIHVHPSYNGTSLRGDIAVIILKSPVEYTDYVRHVCLWESSKTELSHVVGKDGTVVGWGLDESGESPPELMMARMPVVDHQTCIWSYPEFFAEFTSSMTLCAGFKNGTSVCNGDSGGGLVFPAKKRNNASQWHLRALVSLSAPKGATRVCDPNHYVVFTDVAKYLSWLAPYVR